MKSKLFLITLLATATSLANGIREGTFSGHGLWKSEKATGSYQVATKISRDTVATTYELPDGTSKKWTFKMSGTRNGLFKVFAEGKEVGSGYCLDKAEVCHYEAKMAKLAIEETLTIIDGKLYRFGSKDLGQGRVVWQEALVNELEVQNSKDDKNAKASARFEVLTEKLFKQL